MPEEEHDMFRKRKGNPAENDRAPSPVQQFQPPPIVASEAVESTNEISSISSAITIVGKIAGKGTVKISGHIKGEVHASTVLISDGAQVEGDILAEELTISGRVKGTIHANRVKLHGTAIVEGDIFHRSLSIEENARFEGSSRREETAIDSSRVPLQPESTDDNVKAGVAPAAPLQLA